MSYRAIQDECYEANLQLPKLGLVDLTFGNVSVVDRASAVFGIKPKRGGLREAEARKTLSVDRS